MAILSAPPTHNNKRHPFFLFVVSILLFERDTFRCPAGFKGFLVYLLGWGWTATRVNQEYFGFRVAKVVCSLMRE